MERVRALLDSDTDIVLPWPVLMETFYITAREGGEEQALLRYAAIKQLPVTIDERMNEPLLLQATRLKAFNSISIVDALIASFAMDHNAVLLHKDPEYESLTGQLEMEILPYK